MKQKDGSDAGPVYVVDGKVVENIEDIDRESIESMEVYKGYSESPLIKKYNAKDGLFVITTKESAASSKENEMESFEKDGEIFYIVEDMPKFPGGTTALKTYVYGTLEYPENAKNKGIEGEAVVRFLVTEQGKVENSEVLRSSNQEFDAPALKVVKEMPDWIPGKQRGKAVIVWFVMSIKFDDKMK
jgi:protein TonB